MRTPRRSRGTSRTRPARGTPSGGRTTVRPPFVGESMRGSKPDVHTQIS